MMASLIMLIMVLTTLIMLIMVMTMIMMIMTKMVVMMIPAKYYLVDFDAGELESDPHSPRARGTEVGIKFWPGDKFSQKLL